MKVTFLLTQSLESPSGLGRYWPIAKQLSKLGHSVTILALHHNLSELECHCFVQDGVDVWYVGQMHVRKVKSHKYYFGPLQLLWIIFRSTLALAWAAWRVPTDIYVLGKPHPMNGLAVIAPHFLKRKPVYLDCDDYEAGSNRFSANWQRRVVVFFEDHLPGFANGVTVNTHFLADRLAALGYPSSRIVYVPNGVDRERFPIPDDAALEQLRRKLSLEGKKVALYLGSMSLANHAVDLLLKAFAMVRQVEEQAVLLLVGGGEDYDRLQIYAQSLGLDRSALFVGHIAPSEAPLYYHLAHVSVDPIYDDAVASARSPLKIMESLVAGVPVITGNVGDRTEILSAGGGLLIPPGDADALAEALLRMFRDEPFRAHCVSEALLRGQSFYWDVLITKFVKVYEDCASCEREGKDSC